MEQIRIKLDLPFEYALRIAGAMAADAHNCEKMARVYEESKKPAYAKFYGMLANKGRMIKHVLDLQIGDAKNIYIEGCEDE